MRIDPSSATNRLFTGFLRSTPIPCRIVYGCLLIGALILVLVTVSGGGVGSLLEYTSVVPFRLLPPNFWLWTLGTFWIFETNVVLFACHLVCVHISGLVSHSLWGWREWSRYFVLTNLAGAGSTVLVGCFVYLLTKNESWYFYSSSSSADHAGGSMVTTIRGLAAFDGAVLVAVKQALPDTVLFNTPWLGRYKNAHFPFTALLIGVLVTATGLMDCVYFLQFLFGSYAGWVYLRFYQKHPSAANIAGDPSDNFSFASFFPSIVQPPISVVSNAFYRVSVRVGLCKPAVRRFVVDMSGGSGGGPFQGVVTVPTGGPTANQADADRRRQKALRDLNERLAKASQQQSSSSSQLAWPSLIDDDDQQDQQAAGRAITHDSTRSTAGRIPATLDPTQVTPPSSSTSVTVGGSPAAATSSKEQEQ